MIFSNVFFQSRIILTIFSICMAAHTALCTKQPVYIDTLYGSMLIEDEAALDILSSEAMLRLKKINQYGIWAFIKEENVPYTRYDHSLGVYFLLKKFNASTEEAIFGLIHDISHTVFSHVADFMFNTVTQHKSYQDNILSWYADNTDLKNILEKHHLEHLLDNTVQEHFIMHKNHLPDLCADRLEYNLYGGFVEGWITKEEIQSIVNNLAYTNNGWVFKNNSYAKKLALVSIKLSIDNWCDPANSFVYHETADMLSYALQKNIISSNDFHFSNDESVWNVLSLSKDLFIQKNINKIKKYSKHFYVTNQEDYDIAVQTKFRGIDPLVETTGDGIKRLSETDIDFATYFANAKRHCTKTIYLKKTNHSPQTCSSNKN